MQSKDDIDCSIDLPRSAEFSISLQICLSSVISNKT